MAVKARNAYPAFWRTVRSRPAPRRPGVVADVDWPPGERPLRVVVVGKGGAGKSVIAGTMARILARRGRRVLALDTDTMPGLALSLGAASAPSPPLAEAVEEEDGCWRLKPGIGPVRAVQRFSRPAPDGVRILEVGDQFVGGKPPITPSVHAFYQVIHGLPEATALRDWTMIGDHPAGPRQTTHDWAPYADTLLVAVEPSWKSALTARRLVDLADAREAAVFPVATKVTSPSDISRAEEILGRPVVATVPADDAVVESDRLGVALIDHAPASPAARAIEDLVDRLIAGTMNAVASR
jgi:CO dehydrogenase maturation factor